MLPITVLCQTSVVNKIGQQTPLRNKQTNAYTKLWRAGWFSRWQRYSPCPQPPPPPPNKMCLKNNSKTKKPPVGRTVFKLTEEEKRATVQKLEYIIEWDRCELVRSASGLSWTAHHILHWKWFAFHLEHVFRLRATSATYIVPDLSVSVSQPRARFNRTWKHLTWNVPRHCLRKIHCFLIRHVSWYEIKEKTGGGRSTKKTKKSKGKKREKTGWKLQIHHTIEPFVQNDRWDPKLQKKQKKNRENKMASIWIQPNHHYFSTSIGFSFLGSKRLAIAHNSSLTCKYGKKSAQSSSCNTFKIGDHTSYMQISGNCAFIDLHVKWIAALHKRSMGQSPKRRVPSVYFIMDAHKTDNLINLAQIHNWSRDSRSRC